jgi:hypothetical protein
VLVVEESFVAGSSGFGSGVEKGFESSYSKAHTAVGMARPPMLVLESDKEVKALKMKTQASEPIKSP